jgi:hypothetical protein
LISKTDSDGQCYLTKEAIGSAEFDQLAHGSGEQPSGVDFRDIMSCDRSMGGRKKFYHDMDEIESHPSVKEWLAGVKQGPSRTAARYNFARFIARARRPGKNLMPLSAKAATNARDVSGDGGIGAGKGIT